LQAYLVDLGYFLMLCGFLARDVLYLRVILVVAQSTLAAYGWLNGLPAIGAWNSIMVSINTVMAARIVHERRAVELPADLRPLYDRHFSALSPAEFLRWWKQGRRETIENGRLARAGERPDSLYFILGGTVRVHRNAEILAELPAGYFVAEMSLLTGKAANADVDAVGRVEVMRWETGALRDLHARNPLLWTRIQSVIGHDLVEKIQLQEARARTAAPERLER
jgi:CRP-like cAMP-binding protein